MPKSTFLKTLAKRIAKAAKQGHFSKPRLASGSPRRSIMRKVAGKGRRMRRGGVRPPGGAPPPPPPPPPPPIRNPINSSAYMTAADAMVNYLPYRGRGRKMRRC